MSSSILIDDCAKSSIERRAILLAAMDQLKERSVGCANCPGTCCTFVANSMQVTPIEALDLYNFLKAKGVLGEELWANLESNIKEFRLNAGPHVGAGRAFRRTYTCPFFAGGSLGCTVSPEAKPYGCLAFNPSRSLEDSGKSCSSERSLLEDREEALSSGKEELLNEELRSLLQLEWLKESIPVALLSIRDKMASV